MRLICIVCALIYCTVLSAADDYTLPSKVQSKLDQHKEDVAEIMSEARDEIRKSQIKMMKMLEKELKSETRKGHFDNAMAITKMIDSLHKEDEEVAVNVLGEPIVPITTESRIKILKVALATNDDEQQQRIGYNFDQHVQKMVDNEKYVIDFNIEFGDKLPKDFKYNKAWVDYTLDGGKKVYLEARNGIITIPTPLAQE